MGETEDTKKLRVRNSVFNWGEQTYIMGVLNVTPDSFSDGGDFDCLERAIEGAQKLVTAGVDILDIGGQSTRPGAEEVSVVEEINRVLPVIKALRKAGFDVPISVDTTRSEVARAAIECGADIVNDISGATFDEKMLSTVAGLDVPIVLMHIRGTPQTMQKLTEYKDLVGEIYEFFSQRIEAAVGAGVSRSNIILDPGIGFAKTYEQNLELIRKLGDFSGLGCPLLVGPSRKSFIGHILNKPIPKDRVWGTSAVCSAAVSFGVDILRVHDVAEMRDVVRVADAIFR
ncbi:MAG TPA: dihydropteroate synthase [Halomicronema sp.]